VAVVITGHNKKEWLVIALLLGFTGFCYVYQGKNDLLRLATFLLATRNIDLKKAMKYSLYLSGAGFIVIMALAAAGILGDVSITTDFGRHVQETRFVFGFGHPNTLMGCSYAILLMWLWVYGRTAGFIPYLLVSLGVLGISELTGSRTGMLVVVLTLAVSFFARVMPRWLLKKWFYGVMALVSPIVCVLLSVYAAYMADWVYLNKGPYDARFWNLEEKINYRISNIYYAAEDRSGIISRWQLIAGKGHESYFDMGWVRLFYWYGIIPAVLIVVLALLVIYRSYKVRDLWTVIMVFSLGIYTLVEATFVSRYIGRDFFLLVAGVYVWDPFLKRGDRGETAKAIKNGEASDVRVT
jgi:hypothetical protein